MDRRVVLLSLHFRPHLRTHLNSHRTIITKEKDVPEAIRGYRKETNGRCSIEFRYLINDEPRKNIQHSQHLNYVIGKNSRRLYALEFDVESSLSDKLKPFDRKLRWAEMSRTLDKIAKDKNEPVSAQNSQLVREVLLNNRSKLFDGEMSPA